MPPQLALPLSEEWTDVDSYVDALLSFVTSSDLFRHICGGVHILDFCTRDPDLYTSLLSEEWRQFFDFHDIHDLLDLFLRVDLRQLSEDGSEKEWRGTIPPASLIEYLQQIRRLSLIRDFYPLDRRGSIPKRLAVGMKHKKYHEVENFANYVDSLCSTVAEERGEGVSHIVDFGSGQNYLGRTLASAPYDKHIIAVERKHQLVSGAKGMDVNAKLAERKPGAMRVGSSKATRRARFAVKMGLSVSNESETVSEAPESTRSSAMPESAVSSASAASESVDTGTTVDIFRDLDIGPEDLHFDTHRGDHVSKANELVKLDGAIDYVEHDIQDGYLEPIIKDAVQSGNTQNTPADHTNGTVDTKTMVVSLHSCGNLIHHGLRSLALNPSVVAVAMIGCCYNLMSERLGPATYKLPALRSVHPRLAETSREYDPHGFPMSKLLEEYEHGSGTGVKLNITSRSMALQAPANWSRDDSENFFTRHFYRALLQRVLMDHGVVPKPVIPNDIYEDTQGTALIVGSMRKIAFVSFPVYARAAMEKLSRDPQFGEEIQKCMAELSDDDLARYDAEYSNKKKELSVVWSLMAVTAGVAEALVLVDRWSFLRQHDFVKDCWVEPVFDYGKSPRNLAVIGIKK